MLGSSFSASSSLTAFVRRSLRLSPSGPSTWLSSPITGALQSVSRSVCTHPIHTLVFVAVLASTTYIGLLEGSVFRPTDAVGPLSSPTDWKALIEGSKTLCVAGSTGWKWQSDDSGRCPDTPAQHLALLTLLFPDALAAGTSQPAPGPDAIPLAAESTSQRLPSTAPAPSPISQDATLAFSVPYDEAPAFLSAAHEIPVATGIKDEAGPEDGGRWIMKAATRANPLSRRGVRNWARNAWSGLVDLLKNAESLDIIIVFLGYLLMHLTFVSLFLSMRRMGSNFWLAATVLCSSVFAFLFGLTVTTKLGVPLNVVLLSEGLPFLVVTIGFEKPIALTQVVLAASLNARRPPVRSTAAVPGPASARSETGAMSIQHAVQSAVQEKGYEIVRDYVIEILILAAGAASGVQGGLRPFCFLAAWILFFDCLLLFTFYTAILTVKLEINRIKRHVALRKALEEDGVSKRVAENVARSIEWPKSVADSATTDGAGAQGMAVFGKRFADSSVPRFKLLMVSGFVVVNLINICSIPFRGSSHGAPAAAAAPAAPLSAFPAVFTPSSMDPFAVAGRGLEVISRASVQQQRPTVVTVLAPIKYLRQHAAERHPAASPVAGQRGIPVDAGDDDREGFFDGMGAKMVDSLLKSLEDPVLSKWIILTLGMSLVLNGYLFNAARWSIKDAQTHDDSERRSPAATESAESPSSPSSSTRSPARGPTPHGGVVHDDPTRAGTSGRPGPIMQADDGPPSGAGSGVGRFRAAGALPAPATRVCDLTDAELVDLSLRGQIPGHALEKRLGDPARAVRVRRSVVSRSAATSATTSLLETSLLPHQHYDYAQVLGACCENVIGYMPLPVGVAGPLLIDGQQYYLPMATTEGVLVASTSRGCKAINAGGGAVTVLTGDGMTRGPCISFETLDRAGAAKLWLDSDAGQKVMKRAFDATSRFARLQSMKTALAGTYLFVRFKTTTGDAMGMNMISKGVEHALAVMATESGFEDMTIVSVSGNYCTDKKAAAINWIDGRGKSVVAEAIIPAAVVRSVLKSEVATLVELNTAKNLIGSAMAGSIGGFNAHAANIVTAIFLATGQDPAQTVESSNCITIMKNLRGNLQISVSMPSIEVGTVGGGTVLEPQGAMLDLLGVRGPHPTTPGDNARKLARIVAAGVLAGELSLCSALAAGHLVRSHLAHNRSTPVTRVGTPVNALLPLSGAGAGAGAVTEARDGLRPPR
ncbi:MAG: 3-hydroxy-3-methylglutaryl-coenzyme A (HMG-CoA) reductase isozyme [Phylliscum demangeonii]|nr:MAG: 3-hydroxy-3-methylglutaryl-coenzyme A (HMG-CoA) reductase isozyme [Phylliscum demangeonii]